MPPMGDTTEREPFTAEQVACVDRRDVGGPDRAARGPVGDDRTPAGRGPRAPLGGRRPRGARPITVRHTLVAAARAHSVRPRRSESRRTVHLPMGSHWPRSGSSGRRQLGGPATRGPTVARRGLVFSTAGRNGAWTPADVTRRYHAGRVSVSASPTCPGTTSRHFAATALLAAGEDLFVVSRILGHTSVATTASFYGHVRARDAPRAPPIAMDELMRKASGS